MVWSEIFFALDILSDFWDELKHKLSVIFLIDLFPFCL